MSSESIIFPTITDVSDAFKMPEESLITKLSKATNIPEERIKRELNKAIHPEATQLPEATQIPEVFKMPEASLITELSKATNIPEESIRIEFNKAINPAIESTDPSIAKMQDLQELAKNPPKLPLFDVFTIEPKLTVALTQFLDIALNSLTDPKLSQMIIDNITKMAELSLENKNNKIEYLVHDTKELKKANKDNSMIINNIHNEVLKNKPVQVTVDKGGRKPFFTEKECSFF